jgi:hypothetical protein
VILYDKKEKGTYLRYTFPQAQKQISDIPSLTEASIRYGLLRCLNAHPWTPNLASIAQVCLINLTLIAIQGRKGDMSYVAAAV